MAQANGFTSTWFRALNNSLNVMAATDPGGALEAVTAGLAVARRLGDERWVNGLTSQLTFIGIRTGGWDNIAADGERMLAATTDARARQNAVDNIASLRAMRGEPIDDLVAELEATDALEHSEMSKMFVLDVKGWQAFATGRLEAAMGYWEGIAEDPSNASSAAQALTRGAIWLGDVDAVERWTKVFWDNTIHGGAPEADRIAYDAAAHGLRGDRSGATERYRDALRRYRDLHLELDEAALAIDMAYVLGPSDPLTIETVARARTVFATNHARTYLDHLEVAARARRALDWEREGRDARSSTGRRSNVLTWTRIVPVSREARQGGSECASVSLVSERWAPRWRRMSRARASRSPRGTGARAGRRASSSSASRSGESRRR